MNAIVRQLHSEVYRFRRVIIFLLLSLGFTAVFAKKVIWKYSIEAGLNFANQISYNPLNIENETYHWKSLKSPAAYGVIEFQKGKSLSLLGKVGYEQKGFRSTNMKAAEQTQTIQTASIQKKNVKAKFHYSCLQAQVRYHFGHSNLQPFVNAGMALNVLLATKGLESELFQHANSPLYDYHHFQTLSLGAVAGLGLLIDERFGITLDSNLDLTQSVNTLHLHVKNWVNSIKVIVGLNQFFE